jgi:hypothetical protein
MHCMGNNEKISGRIWKPLVGRFCETPRRLAQTPYNLITEGFFTVVRGGQGIFADCDCGRAGVLNLIRLEGVELDVFRVFRGNVCVRIDGVHRANLHACHAIDTVVSMNYHLGIHLVEACDRADFYAVGEFASVTFLGHDVGHSASVINSGLGEKTLLRVLSDDCESTPNAFGVKFLPELSITCSHGPVGRRR